MIYESKIQTKGIVTFPEFKAERIYMLPFFQKNGLPAYLNRWQKTIDQMLDGILTDQPIYLMIDQAFVMKGNTHRRSGLHIDGYWDPSLKGHGTGGGGGGHKSNAASWNEATFKEHEALLLASNVSASKGYVGSFKGPINNGGDCSHIDTKNLKEIILEAGQSYIGNVTSLHESIPVLDDSFRTLVRLNIPGFKI